MIYASSVQIYRPPSPRCLSYFHDVLKVKGARQHLDPSQSSAAGVQKINCIIDVNFTLFARPAVSGLGVN